MKRLILWTLVVTAVAVAFTATHRGPLAAPPLGSVADLRHWLGQRDPITASFAGLRLAAMVAAAYVVAVAAVGWLSRGRTGFARVVDRVTVPAVRPLVARAAGAGLASAVVVPTAALAAPAPPQTEPMVLLGDDDDADTAGTATMRVLPPEDPPPARATPTSTTPTSTTPTSTTPTSTTPTSTTPTTPTSTATTTTTSPSSTPTAATGSVIGEQGPEITGAGPASPPTAATAAAMPATTWIIEPGEHLWAVAESHLADTWGRPPSDRETTRYWRVLVEHNRPGLPDPANPDLVFPGAVVELPPV